jgi:uncharacterized protein (DUF885 family)
MTPEQHLADLAARYWAILCAESPFSAILAGAKVEGAILFRESAADHTRRDGLAAELLTELATIPTEALGITDRATHQLLQRELSDIRAQFAVHAHLRPWLLPVGPDFNTVFFANSIALTTTDDARLYADRLETIPAFLQDIMDNLSAGHALGIRYPADVLAAAAANSAGMAKAAPEASPWYGPFTRSAATFPNQAGRARAIIADQILPALRRYVDHLSGAIANGARATMACTDSPDGEAYYRTFVRHFTTTDMEPAAIHQLGLAEVARLESAMAEVAADAGFPGDIDGYRRHLQTDPAFIPPTAEALLQLVQILCKRIDRQIPAWFKRIPRITYGVESIPPALSVAMPSAYAQPSPADGSSAGIFWVSSLPEKCPTYTHAALAAHEAWPGHLMHIALMQELEGLPDFRRHGAVKYTACVEGWALYCEGLASEMGLYPTPHDRFGWLEMEMWRACRLVVDTGLHWHGWSRPQAIDYMAARLTLSRDTIAAEVDRYAALPGQALAYQIGNLKLRALRRRAEAALGDRFTHRDFHEVVMTAGGVTLPILEEIVDDWLSRVAGPQATLAA